MLPSTKVISQARVEWSSSDCGKTNTKVIHLANHINVIDVKNQSKRDTGAQSVPSSRKATTWVLTRMDTLISGWTHYVYYTTGFA